MRAGFFTVAAGLLVFGDMGAALTPKGVMPMNTENMTNYYDTSTLATNGVNVAKASLSPHLHPFLPSSLSPSPYLPPIYNAMQYDADNGLKDTTIAPTVALDKVINGTTFALIMFDPDTPATGIGGNGTNSFMHWFQDGLTSSAVATKVGGASGKEVFNLVNVGNKTVATASYMYVSP